MYLLSQNKKILIKFEKLTLSKTFGSYYINAFGVNNMEIIGEYDNEEQAKQEFQHIMDALRQGQTVYEVR